MFALKICDVYILNACLLCNCHKVFSYILKALYAGGGGGGGGEGGISCLDKIK